MQTTGDLTKEIRNFALFSQVGKMIFENSMRIKCSMWTCEILTHNCFQIINEFLDTSHNNIDEFFEEYLFETFGHDLLKKQKYCWRLYMSLQHFQYKSQIVAVLYELFSTRIVYPIFNLFWEMKELILGLKVIRSSYHVLCDEIFLNERQWQYVLRQIFLFSLPQITEFESELGQIVYELKREKKSRANFSKYMRNGEYCSSFFIYMGMQKFYQILEISGHTSGSIIKLDHDSDYKEILLRASIQSEQREDYIQEVIQVARTPDVHREIYKSKLTEVKRLMKEIKAVSKNIGMVRVSTARTIGVLEEIDKIGEFCKTTLTERRQEIMKMKDIKAPNDQESTLDSTLHADFLMPEIKDLEKIEINNAADVKRKIRATNFDFYMYLKNKLVDDKPALHALVARLKKIIFDSSFNLSRDHHERTMSDFKFDVNKLFGQMNRLERPHVLILDSILNNIPSSSTSEYEEIKIGNTFNFVSENLLSHIDMILNSGDLLFEDRVSVQNIDGFETFNLDMAKPLSVKFDSFKKKTDLSLKNLQANKDYGSREMKEQLLEVGTDSDKIKFLKDEFYDILRWSKNLGLYGNSRVFSNSKKRMSLTKRDPVFDDRLKETSGFARDIPSTKTNFSFAGQFPTQNKSKTDIESLKRSEFEASKKEYRVEIRDSINVFENSDRYMEENYEEEFHKSLRGSLQQSNLTDNFTQQSSKKQLKGQTPSLPKDDFPSSAENKQELRSSFTDTKLGRSLSNTQGSKLSKLVPVTTHADQSMDEQEFSPEVNSLEEEDIDVAPPSIKPESIRPNSIANSITLRRISDNHLTDLTTKLMRDA